MDINKIIVILTISLTFISCNKESSDLDNLSQNDYLIFGHFHGFCHGERCNEIYQIKDTKVYEDTKDIYRSLNDFNFIALGAEKYDSIK